MGEAPQRSKKAIVADILPYVRKECLDSKDHRDTLMALFGELCKAGASGAPLDDDEDTWERPPCERAGNPACPRCSGRNPNVCLCLADCGWPECGAHGTGEHR